MTKTTARARLLNADGELIAEGACSIDESTGQATLEPERAPGMVQKERGPLVLELDSGQSFRITDRPLVMRVRPDVGARPREVLRLRLNNYAQEANAAGGAGEGASAVPQGRLSANGRGETPAAR